MRMKQSLFPKWLIAVSLLSCAVTTLQGQDFVQLHKKNRTGFPLRNNKPEPYIPLKNILASFETKYRISILYKESTVINKMAPAINPDNYPVDTALRMLLTPLGLTYKKPSPTQVIIMDAPGAAGSRMDVNGTDKGPPVLLKGTVKNQQNEPMPFVSVIVTGSGKGTVTDARGRYQLPLSPGNYKILFSNVGYSSYTAAIKAEGADIKKDVRLSNAVADLSGVVVSVGSRASPRTFTTTSLPVDNIHGSELQTTGQLSLDKALQYRAPSFNTVNMPVHDATSLSDPYEIRNMGPSRTLILINGKRKNPGSIVYIQTSIGRGETETDLAAIPMEAIKRVEILRDGASAQYGSDAIAGVVNIILKDRFEYTQFKTATGITHKGDGLSYVASLNSGANIGDKGFINYTVSFQKEDKTNRAGKVDAWQDNMDLSEGTAASLAQVKAFLDQFPDANNISGTPSSTVARFLVNTAIPIKQGITLYSNAAFVYKNIQSFANYRTPYWKQDPYNLLHAPGSTYLGFRPTFDGDLHDYNATAGVKSGKSWQTDISVTVGGNRQLYSVGNTWNPSMGAQSPVSFKPGGYAFRHLVGNVDATKTVNNKLSVGFGCEFRSENFRIIEGDTASYYGVGSISFSGISAANATNAHRFNIGGYADASYDVSTSVLINATARQEYYSDFGNAFVWKLSGRSKLAEDRLTLRASVSTGFRAPSLHQINLQTTQQVYVPGRGIQTKGIISNKSAEARLLEVPQLKPERSLNFTAGAGLLLSPNFSVTLDYYNIDIRNRIILSSDIGPTSGGGTRLDNFLNTNHMLGLSFFTNAIRTNTQGIDLVANYGNIPIGQAGKLTLNLAGNYTISNRVVGGVSNLKLMADAGQVIFDYVQEALLLTSRPKYKVILGGDLAIKRWNLHLNHTLFGPATFRNEGLDKQLKLVFRSKVVTDLYASYQFCKRFSTSLAVNNMLNVLPAYQLKALNNGGQAILNDPALVKHNINAITFNGRYSIATHDGAHFSQSGATFLLTMTFKL
jgi:iron complex outermembrane receptor protein